MDALQKQRDFLVTLAEDALKKKANEAANKEAVAAAAAAAMTAGLKAAGIGTKPINTKGGSGTMFLMKYASGGMNEEPGPAMLHGTKSKPEAVLNPEQTRMLKEDILGGGSNSLLSSLVAFKNTLNNTVDGSKFTALASSTQSSDSVVIEHAEVNLNATIANDYDARRAGNLVMDEMVKIARKNGMQNNIRR